MTILPPNLRPIWKESVISSQATDQQQQVYLCWDQLHKRLVQVFHVSDVFLPEMSLFGFALELENQSELLFSPKNTKASTEVPHWERLLEIRKVRSPHNPSTLFISEFRGGTQVRNLFQIFPDSFEIPHSHACFLTLSMAEMMQKFQENIAGQTTSSNPSFVQFRPENVFLTSLSVPFYRGLPRNSLSQSYRTSEPDATDVGGRFIRHFPFPVLSPDEVKAAPPTQETTVFLLGIFLHQLLRWQTPYPVHSSIIPTIQEMLGCNFLLIERKQSIPPELKDFLFTAIAPEPSQRFSTVAEFCQHLRQFAKKPTPRFESEDHFIQWFRTSNPTPSSTLYHLSELEVTIPLSQNLASYMASHHITHMNQEWKQQGRLSWETLMLYLACTSKLTTPTQVSYLFDDGLKDLPEYLFSDEQNTSLSELPTFFPNKRVDIGVQINNISPIHGIFANHFQEGTLNIQKGTLQPFDAELINELHDSTADRNSYAYTTGRYVPRNHEHNHHQEHQHPIQWRESLLFGVSLAILGLVLRYCIS